MKVKALVLFVFAMLLLITSCKNKITCRELGTDYFSISAGLKSKSDSLEFISQLDHVLLKTPYCIKALQLRGIFLADYEEYDQAREDFYKAFQIDSTDVYTLFHLGMLYNIESKNDSALYCLNKAIRIKTKNGFVLEYNEAFSKKLDVKYDAIIHFRGIVLYEQGRIESAKRQFLACIRNNYKEDYTDGYLASIYRMQNNKDSACYYHQQSMFNGRNYVLDTSLFRMCSLSRF